MSQVSLLDDVRKAAGEFQSSEHRLRLALTAAVAAEVPIAATDLASLPVQRPQAVKEAPVLILGTRRRRQLVWDGRRGKAAGYAGDRLGVFVPGKIVDVIAESWALAGDASGAGQRPRTGERVILEDGVLGMVEDPGDDGGIRVVAGGELLTRNWWAIVLPGI